ncbi:MAG: ThuA domain-containing protein [Candidatus Latescibacteria bacterium]|nr:ThuA domain-containing protein [Candidatus Latescibacterota bacterium]
MATAFALVGDRYHTSDYIRTALSRTLVQGMGLSIDFTDEITLLNAQHLSSYRLLIVFRDGMIWPNGYGIEAASVSEPPVEAEESRPVQWITEDQGRAVRNFVEAGGAALFYHNSTYIAPGSSDFRHVLGAATQGHPPVRPYRVHITRTDHPITRGVEDFVVEDEQHFMQYDKDPAHVLAVSVNDDGAPRARRLGRTSTARAACAIYHRDTPSPRCGTRPTRSCNKTPCAGCCATTCRGARQLTYPANLFPRQWRLMTNASIGGINCSTVLIPIEWLVPLPAPRRLRRAAAP